MTLCSPFIMIGLILSVLAGVAAFLITYEEWSHHYTDRRKPLRYSIEAALAAFVVFAFITLVVNLLMSRFI